MKSFKEYLMEATYAGNLGAIEMIQFFQQASDKDILKMKIVVDREDWIAYKKLIKKVLNVSLK